MSGLKQKTTSMTKVSPPSLQSQLKRAYTLGLRTGKDIAASKYNKSDHDPNQDKISFLRYTTTQSDTIFESQSQSRKNFKQLSRQSTERFFTVQSDL